MVINYSDYQAFFDPSQGFFNAMVFYYFTQGKQQSPHTTRDYNLSSSPSLNSSLNGDDKKKNRRRNEGDPNREVDSSWLDTTDEDQQNEEVSDSAYHNYHDYFILKQTGLYPKNHGLSDFDTPLLQGEEYSEQFLQEEEEDGW